MQNPNYWGTGASSSKSSNQYWNKSVPPNKSGNLWYENQQEHTNTASVNSYTSYYPNANDESCTEYFTYPQENISVDPTSNAVAQPTPPSTINSRDPRTRRHLRTPVSSNSHTSQIRPSISNSSVVHNQSSTIASSQVQYHSNTFDQKATNNNTSSYLNTYTSTNFPPNSSYSGFNPSYVSRNRTYKSPSSYFKNRSSINQEVPSYSSSDINSSLPSYSTASPERSQNTNSHKQSTILERKHFAPKTIPEKPKSSNLKPNISPQFKNRAAGSSKQVELIKHHSQVQNKTEFAAPKSKFSNSKSTTLKSLEKSVDTNSVKQRSKAKVTTESVPSLENEKSIENLINKFFTAEERSKSRVKSKSNESKSIREEKNAKSDDKGKKEGKSFESKPKSHSLSKDCKDSKKSIGTSNETLKGSLISDTEPEICSSLKRNKYKNKKKSFDESLLSVEDVSIESKNSVASKIGKVSRSNRKSKKIKGEKKTIEEILRAMQDGDNECKETLAEFNTLKKSPLRRKSINQDFIANEDSTNNTPQSVFKKIDLLQKVDTKTLYSTLKHGSNLNFESEIKNKKSPKKDKNGKILHTGKSKKQRKSKEYDSQDLSDTIYHFSENKCTPAVNFTCKNRDGSESKLKLTKNQLKIINMTSRLVVSISSVEKTLAENARSVSIIEQNKFIKSPKSKKFNLSNSITKNITNVNNFKKVSAKKSLTKRVHSPSKIKKKIKQATTEIISNSLSLGTSKSEENAISKVESNVKTLEDIHHYKIFNKKDCSTVLNNIDDSDSLCKSSNIHALVSNVSAETSNLSDSNRGNHLSVQSKKDDFDTIEEMDQLLQETEETISPRLEESCDSTLNKKKYLDQTDFKNFDAQRNSTTLEKMETDDLFKKDSADICKNDSADMYKNDSADLYKHNELADLYKSNDIADLYKSNTSIEVSNKSNDSVELYKSNDSANLSKNTDSSSSNEKEYSATLNVDTSTVLRKNEDSIILDKLDIKVVFNEDENSSILETDNKALLNRNEDSLILDTDSKVMLNKNEGSIVLDELDSNVSFKITDSIKCDKIDNEIATSKSEDSVTFDETDSNKNKYSAVCNEIDNEVLESKTENLVRSDDSILQKVDLLDKVDISAELESATLQSSKIDQSCEAELKTDESFSLDKLCSVLNDTDQFIAADSKVNLTNNDIKTTSTMYDFLMDETSNLNTSNSVCIDNTMETTLSASNDLMLNNVGIDVISNESNCISVPTQKDNNPLLNETVLNDIEEVNSEIRVPLDTVNDTKDITSTELGHSDMPEKPTDLLESPVPLNVNVNESSEICDVLQQGSSIDHIEQIPIVSFSETKNQKSKKSFRTTSFLNNKQRAKKSFTSPLQSENKDKSPIEKRDSNHKRKFKESNSSQFLCEKSTSDENINKIKNTSIYKAFKSFKPLSLRDNKPLKNNFPPKDKCVENASYHGRSSGSVAKKSCVKLSSIPAPNRNRAHKSVVPLNRVNEETNSTSALINDKEDTTGKELDSNKTIAETIDSNMDVAPSFQSSDVVTNHESEPEIIFETSQINQGSDSDMEVMEEKSLSRSNSPIKEMVLFKSKCICSAQSVSNNSFDDIFQDKCQGRDSIDGEVVPCTKTVLEHDLISPSTNLPFLKYCDVHTWRLKHHHCCPECGIFCTQGTYIACLSQVTNDNKNQFHLFHKDCFNILDAGLPPGCPHCSRFSDYKVVSLEDKTNDLSIGTNLDLSADVTNITSELECSCILLKEINTADAKAVLPDHPYLYVPSKKEVQSMIMTLSKEKALQLRASGKCLYVPVKVRDAEKVLQMIAIGVNPNQRFEMYNNNTPLHVACSHGFADIAHILIQAGALVDAFNNDLYTPLMVAINKGSLPIVKHLIRVGAQVSAKGEDGMTCFHLATRSGIVKIAQILYETGNVDINAQDEGGWTPIVWACEHNREDMVRWLLEIGADANVRDNEENVSLHWAAYCGDEKIVEALLDYGCNFNVVNKLGDTPLHIAARKDHYKCVKMFAYRGALLEKTNKENLTPLMCCPDSMTRSYKTLNSLRTVSLNKLKNLISDQNIVIRDISRGKEIYPVQVINEVDQEEFIMDFRYILRNCTSTFININILVDNMQMCFCQDNCSSSRCLCSTNSRCWYDVDGHLVIDFDMYNPPPIYECNKTCHCPKTCVNRVVQRGLRYPLQLFRTISKGWGVRTLKPIRKGAFVCEYVGEIISNGAANKRKNDAYLFDLGSNDDSFCLDTHFYGNVSRFLNHSCEPNLIALKVYVEHQDLNFPRIAFFAVNDIGPCEELCFDYGIDFWVVKCRHLLCTCGSSFCKYSKDSIDTTLELYALQNASS